MQPVITLRIRIPQIKAHLFGQLYDNAAAVRTNAERSAVVIYHSMRQFGSLIDRMPFTQTPGLIIAIYTIASNLITKIVYQVNAGAFIPD